MAKRRNDQPRPCFVVVSFEGCAFPDFCQGKHVLVDCTIHGLLARVGAEEVGRFIMAGHLDDPSWPTPVEPPTEASYQRIYDARTGQHGRIFIP